MLMANGNCAMHTDVCNWTLYGFLLCRRLAIISPRFSVRIVSVMSIRLTLSNYVEFSADELAAIIDFICTQ